MMKSARTQTDVFLRPYSGGDFALLERLLGDPKMMVHLGGPESLEKLRERHTKFCAMSSNPEAGRVFVITFGIDKTPVGTVGYWEREWEGQKVWETGWSVLPEFQGQGIATAALLNLVDWVAGLHVHKYLHAYPSIDNHPSNAICRKAGFILMGEIHAEYPKGNKIHCNNWRLDLLTADRS